MRIHGYPLRKVRNPQSGENDQIRIISLWCKTSRRKRRSYTVRILPDFLIPGSVTRDLYGVEGALKETVEDLNIRFLAACKASADGIISHYSYVLKEKSRISVSVLDERSRLIVEDPSLRDSFIYEMKRFLPPKIVKDTVENKDFWIYLSDLIRDECSFINRFLNGESEKIDFKM